MLFPYSQSFLHAEGVSNPPGLSLPPFSHLYALPFDIYWVYLEGGPGYMSFACPLSCSMGCCPKSQSSALLFQAIGLNMFKAIGLNIFIASETDMLCRSNIGFLVCLIPFFHFKPDTPTFVVLGMNEVLCKHASK